MSKRGTGKEEASREIDRITFQAILERIAAIAADTGLVPMMVLCGKVGSPDEPSVITIMPTCPGAGVEDITNILRGGHEAAKAGKFASIDKYLAEAFHLAEERIRAAGLGDLLESIADEVVSKIGKAPPGDTCHAG